MCKYGVFKVIMNNQKLWVSIVAAILVAVMLLSLVMGILPRGAQAATSSELKNQLDELQAQKDSISDKIADLESQQSDNLSDMQGIISQKEIIDQQVALLYAEVDNVNAQISAYSLLIADKQEEMEEAQLRLNELNEQNKERIRAMEEQGELSYWSVLFKANSFSELLDRGEMMLEIKAADDRRLQEMRQIAEEVAKAQEELSVEKAELEKTKAELEASQKELDAKSAEADKLLGELVDISESLDVLHSQFEAEEEHFLNQLINKEQEYNDQLASEAESSRQASIQASIQESSIQESIRESSIQESIRESSIQASIEAEQQTTQATTEATVPSSSGNGGSANSDDNPSGTTWLTPCDYTYVSSPFGYRWHPTTGKWSMHQGVDLPAPKGTPIYASRSGYVTIAKYHVNAGNYVTINHQDGYTSVYMHMTHYVVEVGDYVKAGELIGYVGSTGRSTGPHLHFGIAYNGEYVNPMDYIG